MAGIATKCWTVQTRSLLNVRKTRSRSFSIESSIPQSKQKYVPRSGTYPQGFSVAGVHVGVKPSNTSNPDLALIVSDRPAAAAAVFTKNKFLAAPVQLSKLVLAGRQDNRGLRAILVNAGCANAITGKQGMKDARLMAQAVNKRLAKVDDTDTNPVFEDDTLVMSTGVIGQLLPMSKILPGIPKAYSSLSTDHDSWLTAARAICTTDTFPKLMSTSFTLPSLPGISYSLAGMTKGAGMIHPNMATLLAIMATDVPIEPLLLRQILERVVQRSFNCISIDGDSSTNDTLAILANGAAGGDILKKNSEDVAVFERVVTGFARKLSQLVVRDGEGATKFVHVHVSGARGNSIAKSVASSIARSPLVKTALYGRDANWGRIACAVGNAEIPESDPSNTSVSFIPVDGSDELRLLVNGEPESVDEERAAEILKAEDLKINVDLGTGGEASADYWFCDFSKEYVAINADYRT